VRKFVFGFHARYPEAMVDVRSFDHLLDRARAMVARPQRSILGITGPPGAGKSTLAQQLVDALESTAVCLSLDGFHLAQSELERTGKDHRKGAPDTFDALGYIALLRRLRNPGEGTIYAPVFHREIEDSIANELAVHSSAKLIITEGNYLLVRSGSWREICGLLDEAWYLDLADDVRIHRLIARHQSYGRDLDTATARALGPDQRNAELIERDRELATLRVSLDPMRATGGIVRETRCQ
jgi:pantothenate kinase